ncbi:hypothetical protein BU23DRAFT_143367 [Bimuria novae-zelandiae CBS 107.79]|uniref:RING-type domain-containing protein n=1 Tax=Bimuria novae-zelandiae CBS 107.79 TaxID=1447943 RepID=A0A6A5V6N7_9PLEO|nr:hypothetical protein BU23DRAFT_143367 [Bimuria novae-zelandiae CBS 107.79]
MSYRIDESIISNFLTNHTRPLQLSALPSDPASRRCPICRDSYHAQDPSYLHPLLPADNPEYPVQVLNCGACRHIFGRHCIERQIRASQPWSHVCPLCRVSWFPAPNAARTGMVGEVENALSALARVEIQDEGVRNEMEIVERGLEAIRERLYSQRWI